MRVAVALSVLLMLPVAGVAAQSLDLAPGERVRVTAPGAGLDRQVMTVVSVGGDSVALTSRSGSRTIALSDVTALDVSTGKRGHMLRDGAIGLGIGALLGGVLVKSASDDCPGGGEYGVCGAPVLEAEATAWGAMVFGGVGLLAGAAIGAFWDRSDRWERSHATVKATIAPSRSGGVSLSFSRAF
jgi:hypothetical protein